MLADRIVFRSKKSNGWFSNLVNWIHIDEKLFYSIQNGGKIVVVVGYYQHLIDLIKLIIPFEINEVDFSLSKRHEISNNRANIIFGLENVDLNDNKIKEDINLALYPDKNTIIICEEEVLNKLEENIDYKSLSYDSTKLNIKDPKMLVQKLVNAHYDIRIQNLPLMQFLCTLDSCFLIWEMFKLEKHNFNFRDYINNIWKPLHECFFKIDKKNIIWHIAKGEEKKYRNFLKEIFDETYVKRFEELNLGTSREDLKKLIMWYSCVMLDLIKIRNSDLILTPFAKELMMKKRQFIPNPLVFSWERFLLQTSNKHDMKSFKSITPLCEWTEHINKIGNVIEEISKQDIKISIPYHFLRLKMTALAILTSKTFKGSRIPENYLGILEYQDKLWRECNKLGKESVKSYSNSLKCITEQLLNEEKTRTELDNFVRSNYGLEENLLMCSPILNNYIEKNANENLRTYLDYQDYLRTFIKEEFIDEIKERLYRDIDKENLQSKLKEFAKILDIYGKFLYLIQATSKADINELMDQMNSNVVKDFLVKIEEEISNYETSKMVDSVKEDLDLVMKEINYLIHFYGPNMEKPFSRFSDITELAETIEELYGSYEKYGITPNLITKLFCYYNKFSQKKSKISHFLVKFYRTINDEIVNQYPICDRLWNVTQIRQIINYLLGEKTNVPEEIEELNPTQIVVLLIMDALSYQDWIGLRANLVPSVAKPILTTFPTETVSCHMSIFTGVFPSQHGAVSNKFINKKNPKSEIVLIEEKEGEEFLSKKRSDFATLTEQRLWIDHSKNYICSSFPSKTKLNQLFKGKNAVDIIASDKLGTEKQRLCELKTILNENIKNIYEKGEDIRILAVILHPRVDRKGHSGVEKDETNISHEYSILGHIEGYITTLLKSIESITEEIPLKIFLIVTGDHGRIQKEDLISLAGTEKVKVQESLIYKLLEEYKSFKYHYYRKMRNFSIYSLNGSDPLKSIPNFIDKENWWILQKNDIDRILEKELSGYKPDLILSPKYQTFYSMREQATHGGFSLHEIFVPLLIFEIGGD